MSPCACDNCRQLQYCPTRMIQGLQEENQELHEKLVQAMNQCSQLEIENARLRGVSRQSVLG